MSIKIFDEGIKFSRRSWRVLLWGFSARNDNEIQTNCRVEFDVKKNKNNKKFPTGNNWIWPSASSIRDLGLWDGLGSLGSISNKKKERAKLISDRSNFQKRPQCERALFRSTTVERKHETSVCSPHLYDIFSTDDVTVISHSIMIDKKNQSFVHVCDLLTATLQPTCLNLARLDLSVS